MGPLKQSMARRGAALPYIVGLRGIDTCCATAEVPEGALRRQNWIDFARNLSLYIYGVDGYAG